MENTRGAITRRDLAGHERTRLVHAVEGWWCGRALRVLRGKHVLVNAELQLHPGSAAVLLCPRAKTKMQRDEPKSSKSTPALVAG